MHARLNNGDMNKQPHIFTWDNEPADERPSVFAASTFAPTTESWFDALPTDRVTKTRRTQPQRNLARTMLSFTVVLSLCGFALYAVAALLRG